MSIESEKAIQELQSKILDLKNVHRLVSNNLNLIYDVDIKGSHVRAINEVVGWLEAFKTSLANQYSALEASLPKPGVVGAQVEPANQK